MVTLSPRKAVRRASAKVKSLSAASPMKLGQIEVSAIDAATGTISGFLSGDTDVEAPGLPVLGPRFPVVGDTMWYVSNNSDKWVLGLPPQGDPNRDLCYAARVTTQTAVTANVFVPVSLTGSPDTYDPSDMHDPSTNPSRINIVHSGVYWTAWGVKWSGAQTGARNAQIRAGGAGSQYLDVRSPMIAVADQTNVGGGPFPDYLNAGSYLELMVSATVANADVLNAYFCVFRWPGT